MKRQGEYVKNYISGASYFSFRPSNLQDFFDDIKIDDEINELVFRVSKNFLIIKKISNYVQCEEIFLYAYAYKEALYSSQIEGTECTMPDILSKDFVKNEEKICDVNEVISNINAINFGIEKLKELPLCIRLYKEIHKVLMQNVQGKNKTPGEIRNTQNWIGGNSIENAKFVPPNVEDMNNALNELDIFANEKLKSEKDVIIVSALIHYQFETIHPFLDGNGRLGRIIILLYLISNDLLEKPLIYISYYLKMYQSEYYDKLMRVRKDGDYEGYIKFFLRCLNETTEDTISKIELLEELHKKNILLLPNNNRKKETINIVFESIERKPIFDIKYLVKKTNLAFNTVDKNIKILKKLGIVEDYNESKRNKVFVYQKLLDIIK